MQGSWISTGIENTDGQGYAFFTIPTWKQRASSEIGVHVGHISDLQCVQADDPSLPGTEKWVWAEYTGVVPGWQNLKPCPHGYTCKHGRENPGSIFPLKPRPQ